jgi:hypothetical protein
MICTLTPSTPETTLRVKRYTGKVPANILDPTLPVFREREETGDINTNSIDGTIQISFFMAASSLSAEGVDYEAISI